MWIAALVACAIGAPPSVTFDEALVAADGVSVVEAARRSAIALGGARVGTWLPLEEVAIVMSPGARVTSSKHVVPPTAAAGMSLSTSLSPAGLLQTGAAVANAGADAAAADADAARQRRRLDVADAWFGRRAAEGELAISAAAEQDAQAVKAAAVGVVVVSDGAAEDDAVVEAENDAVIEADAFVATATLARLEAEARARAAGLRLGRLLGRIEEVATAGAVPVIPIFWTTPNAEVLRAERAVVVATAMLADHDARQGPRVGFGVASHLDAVTGGFVGGQLSLTLPSLQGDPARRATLLRALTIARADVAVARQTHADTVATIQEEASHQATLRRTITATVVPALTARRQLAERRLARGDGRISDVVTAAQATHDANRLMAQAAIAEERAIMVSALLGSAP